LELSPIEFRRSSLHWGRRDVGRRLATQDPRANFSRSLTDRTRREERPSNDAVAELEVVKTKNRRVRHGAQPDENFRLDVGNSTPIDNRAPIQNGRIRRELRDALKCLL
jgi:hypothetical protein